MVRDDRLPEPDTEAVVRAAREACGREVSRVEPISKGINAIYRVTFADGDRAVLKAATFNTTDELRPEPRLLRAVSRGTTVPVPDVLAIAEDGGTLGVFHFVLDYCEGRQIRDLTRLSADEQKRLVRDVGRRLARLHEYRPVETCGPLRVIDSGGERPDFTTGTEYESWGEAFATFAAHPVDLLERVQCGDDPGRFADLVPDVVSAFDGVADAVEDPETPTLLHRDFHLDNFVLAPEKDETDRPIRTVLDFGDPYVGDYRLDLAYAEDAVVNVQLPTSNRANRLADLLRRTYADERGINLEAIVDERYAYYLLVQRARWMAVAMQWDEYDDPAAVERAYRSFVREQLEKIR